MGKGKQTAPWWLTDTTEMCPACSQSYAYHTQVWCVDCDSPLCPTCVQVTTTRELSCPECFECNHAESEVAK